MYGRKDESELKQKRITVQVSIKEKEIIEELARKNYMTVGAFIRKICIYDKFEELFNGDYRWIGVRSL